MVRDFYHRYTVDEHSLRTIEHLQELGEPPEDALGTKFAPLWKTLERRDLLIFAMLLHDIGKGMPVENHVKAACRRWKAPLRDWDWRRKKKRKCAF